MDLFLDLDPAEAERMGSEWMRREELDATISAAGHALLQWVANMFALAEIYGANGFVIPQTDAETQRRFVRFDKLHTRLVDLGARDFHEALVEAAVEHADCENGEVADLTRKAMKLGLVGYLKAEAMMRADDARVTKLAEATLAVRAEICAEPSLEGEVEVERAAYAQARGVVYGARRSASKVGQRVVPPSRAMTEAELDAALAELVA